MKRRMILAVLALLLTGTFMVLDLTGFGDFFGVVGPVRSAEALSGATYTIPWYTLDGGGGIMTSTTYTITGTIGQPDAGHLTGTPYTILGGFWTVGSNLVKLFLPLITK